MGTPTDPKAYALRKLAYAIRRAKDCSLSVRREPKCDRAEYRRLRKEAMLDARWWRAEVARAESAALEARYWRATKRGGV